MFVIGAVKTTFSQIIKRISFQVHEILFFSMHFNTTYHLVRYPANSFQFKNSMHRHLSYIRNTFDSFIG